MSVWPAKPSAGELPSYCQREASWWLSPLKSRFGSFRRLPPQLPADGGEIPRIAHTPPHCPWPPTPWAASVSRHGPGRIPCVDIVDWPDFPVRGAMLDISRDKVPRMKTLYRLVDWLASLKINQLQLYTEHTFAYSKHRVVWKDASPMTPQEIRS